MKMSAIETYALPPGTTVRHTTVADCLGFDHQVCLYRADVQGSHDQVLLYEFLPNSLATRGSQGVMALPGKADALSRALAAYTTRLRAAALVGHPALPTLQDIWQERGTVFAVSPWRAGRSLADELTTRSGTLEIDQLSTWVRSICDALSALHRHDLIHGNLSPGLLRVLDSGELMLPLVGSTTVSTDAPAWIAPEQHPLNPKPHALGPWTDLYQLSAVLHQAITGQAPPAVTRRWEGVPLERLAAMAGRMPEGLLTATRRGLSMMPGARPQSTDAWLREAGLPDRRERPRYADESSDDAAHQAARRSGNPPAEAAADATAATEVVSAGVETQPALTAGSPIEGAPEPTASAAAEATPHMAPASAGGLPTNAGHQPLAQTVEDRLDQLESAPSAVQREPTPAWVWTAVALALAALLGIIFMS